MPVDVILFCDTGLEFPQMYEHLDKVEQYTGRAITRLKPPHSFEYFFYEYSPERKNPALSRYRGLSWPGPKQRWCTGRLKHRVIDAYLKGTKAGIPHRPICRHCRRRSPSGAGILLSLGRLGHDRSRLPALLPGKGIRLGRFVRYFPACVLLVLPLAVRWANCAASTRCFQNCGKNSEPWTTTPGGSSGKTTLCGSWNGDSNWRKRRKKRDFL